MATVGNKSQSMLQRGASDAIASITAANDAAANVDNVSIFTKLIKKAEDSAQSAL